MAKVSLKDFSFRYRKQQEPVLSHIDLEFSTDERILILGPSGGGKSTLLLAILRLYSAYDTYYAEGSITYDGREGNEMSRKEFLELFGVVFQSPSHQFCLPYPDEEAAFGLENLQMDPREMKPLINQAFNHFRFFKRETPIAHLSGGEQQILAAASTTLLDSSMLVMDEPTAHLDPPGRRRFSSAVASWLEKGRGFLIVEHHVDLWLDLVGRVVVLSKEGEIVFDEGGTDILVRERKVLSEMGIWLPEVKSEHRTTSIPLRRKAETALPALQFLDASIGYGQTSILEKLNLTIFEGEMTAIAGTNGCGKSTLLQSLIGLSEIQRGSVKLKGIPLTQKKKKVTPPSSIGYLFQNPELQFIYQSVKEELKGVSGRSVQELLNQLSLEGKERQSPFTLSGGEKRRLSLASLLTNEKDIFLLDEPTFAQDAKTAVELVHMIQNLHEQGKTIVMVSHDLQLFLPFIQRLVVIHEKQIVFSGTLEELKGYPEERREQWGVEL